MFRLYGRDDAQLLYSGEVVIAYHFQMFDGVSALVFPIGLDGCFDVVDAISHSSVAAGVQLH